MRISGKISGLWFLGPVAGGLLLAGCQSVPPDEGEDASPPIAAASQPSLDDEEEDTELSIGDDHAPTVTRLDRVRARATVDELAWHAARKPVELALPVEHVQTVTEETLAWAARRAPDELVTFTLLLEDRPFEWSRLKHVQGSARAVLVEGRQRELEGPQADVVQHLTALGLEVLSRRWVINAVNVRAPAPLASSLAALPGVKELQHGAPVVPLGLVNEGFYGGDLRGAIKADRLLSLGYTGGTGGRDVTTSQSTSSRVRAAVIGVYKDRNGLLNSVPANHPGFMTTFHNASYSRLMVDEVCNPNQIWTCFPDGDPEGPTHETMVMGVLGGSIERGQDPSYTTPQAQLDRSGITPGAYLEYYRAGEAHTDALALAFESALKAGPDVINNSWGTEDLAITANLDLSGFNYILRRTFEAGIVVTWSAGNNNKLGAFSPSCNQNYPSNRPEVITVNGSASQYIAPIGAPEPNPVLNRYAWSTSGCPINVISTDGNYYPRTDNSVGVVAPGVVGMTYSGVAGYSGSANGSSFAAPIVAGAVALLKDARYNILDRQISAQALKADLLMLTDGYSFTSYDDGGTRRTAGGTSSYSGMGRLKLRAPEAASFQAAGWGWTNRNDLLGPGMSETWTVPADIQHYRQASYWVENDLTQAADIDFRIDALNASGQLCGYVTAQSDYSLINGFHLERADIPPCALPGGQLKVTATVYAMASGQTRKVYTSYLYDNEATY